MKAWIITRETPNIGNENCIVVGFLSARKSASQVKDYVEWLYSIFESSVEDFLNSVKYNSPIKSYKAQYFTTSEGNSYLAGIHCGHNPFLIARLASKVTVIENNSISWQEPDRIIADPRSKRIVKKIKGNIRSAKITLPFKAGLKGI